MPFKYTGCSDMSFDGHIQAMEFSSRATYLVIATSVDISIWVTKTWTRCDVVLKKPSPSAIPTALTWIEDETVVVGFSDGSLYTFVISLPESEVCFFLPMSTRLLFSLVQLLTITAIKCTTESISHLSYCTVSRTLAVGCVSKVTLWQRSQGTAIFIV